MSDHTCVQAGSDAEVILKDYVPVGQLALDVAAMAVQNLPFGPVITVLVLGIYARASQVRR